MDENLDEIWWLNGLMVFNAKQIYFKGNLLYKCFYSKKAHFVLMCIKILL